MWFAFLQESFHRLEAFIEPCPYYTKSPLDRIMLLAAYVPMFAWIVTGFLAVYARSLFHATLVYGLLLNGMITWGLQSAITPDSPVTAKLCTHTIPDRACEESAMMGFILVYFIFYDVNHWRFRLNRPTPIEQLIKTSAELVVPVNRLPSDAVLHTAIRLLALFGLVIVSCIAQHYLRLFTVSAIMLGLLTGTLTCTLITIVLYAFIVPNLETPFMRYTAGLLRLPADTLHTFFP